MAYVRLLPLLAGAFVASSAAYLFRRRRRVAPLNPSGIADAYVADEERQRAAERLGPAWGARTPDDPSP